MAALSALVLEDHMFQRSIVACMLRHLGCSEVYEASSGEEAVEILQKNGRVDILICDLCMEGMDGIDFLRHISLSGLVGNVVVCSSLPLELRQMAVQIGSLLGFNILGEMAKPIQSEQLRLLLDQIMVDRESVPVLLESVKEVPSEEDVRRGLRNKEFEAFYQPKLNLKNGTVTGLEVLARWRHPTKGTLSAANFISVIEHCDLMDELFFELLDQGLTLQHECMSQGAPLKLAFNLHAAQLAENTLIPRIKDMLCRHHTSGRGLSFEITESGLLQAPVTSLENLLRLRMLGCGLSIDDFGAGFSSLQRLCQLPFSEIKLDGEFVRSLEHRPRCKAAIKSMQALANSLGMTLVVEGIETIKQHLLVVALGCQQGQGYFYAMPMPREELLTWLRERD